MSTIAYHFPLEKTSRARACQQPFVGSRHRVMDPRRRNPTFSMAALLDPSTNFSLLLQQQEQAKASKRTGQPSPGECILCETCNCYVNGLTGLEAHLQSRQHRKKAKGESLTSHATTGEKGEGIVIPKSTAFVIQQSALFDDARKQYMFSLYERSLLRARM